MRVGFIIYIDTLYFVCQMNFKFLLCVTFSFYKRSVFDVLKFIARVGPSQLQHRFINPLIPIVRLSGLPQNSLLPKLLSNILKVYK